MDKAEKIKAFLDVQNLNTEDTSVEEEASENDFLSKWNVMNVDSSSPSLLARSYLFLWLSFSTFLSWIYGFLHIKKVKFN